MGFIADPNAGPTPKMAESGVLFNDSVSNGVAVLSKSLVSRPLSTGLTFNIRSTQDGTYYVRGIDLDGNIYTITGSTAYAASSGTVAVTYTRFIREAYIEFTPSADATLYVEAYSFGRGA